MPKPHLAYHPLQKTKEIRLAKIRRKPDTATKESLPLVELFHVNLEDKPQYYALSYVCGIEIDEEPLVTNIGKARITKNLAGALRQLQVSYAEEDYFWVDALCIRQDDNAEKSQQITLMKNIFHMADSVVVWLGPDERAEGLDVFSVVEDVYGLILNTINSKLELVNTKSWLPPDDAEKKLKYLAPLFRNPYFNRSWTIQETGISKHSSMLWGNASSDFHKICLTAMMFLRYYKTQAETVGIRHELELITNLYTMYLPSPAPRTLHHVLHEARPHQATDPRDKVYAFISHPAALDVARSFPHGPRNLPKNDLDPNEVLNNNLARILSPQDPSSQISTQSHWARLYTTDLDHEPRPPSPDAFSAHRQLYATSDRLSNLRRYIEGKSFIQPDYDQYLVSVYEDVVRKAIERSNSLEILSFVQHHCPLPMTGPDFPSVRLHTITLTREDFVDPLRTSPVFSMSSHCQVDKDPIPDYPRIINPIMANPDRFQAYCKTWVAGDSDTAWSAHSVNADFLAYQLEFVLRNLELGKATEQNKQVGASLIERGASTGNANHFAECAATACAGRRFFITKAGFFGIGPSTMEQNDSVVVLLGLDVPIILREKSKVGHASDGYAVIGECYVEGIMCGETVQAWGGPDGELQNIKLR
ncbi:hypothetical protein H2200_002066 [Cladophialophora chaetospira]|uniref:Heterokaryon incompatibility domain-containing protein n=1 Tax=Cladophialophora chaetospira TaxID=386627 RepID=A0AA38XI58_9EURO|nr:hypothetical protein H2200_002066 [Cladophialophora chaetospira]